MMDLNYIPLLTGVWMIGWSLMLSGENLASKLAFNVFPFFLGMGCMYSAAVGLGWIIIS